MRPLRGEEEWARQLIEVTLGVPVEQHDDGSRDAMHDLTIVYPEDGPQAAVEVTGAVDSATTELWNISYRDGRWIEPGLAGGWAVDIKPDATRVKRRGLRTHLPALLADLEAAGLREYPAVETPAATQARARELGVVRAHQSGTDFPGSIYVMPDLPVDQVAGYGDPAGDAVAVWVGDFLHHPDRAGDCRKLASSNANERHAFVIVSTTPGVPFEVTNALVSDETSLPTVEPPLPREVTHAWVVSQWAPGSGFRWVPQAGWHKESAAAEKRSPLGPRQARACTFDARVPLPAAPIQRGAARSAHLRQPDPSTGRSTTPSPSLTVRSCG